MHEPFDPYSQWLGIGLHEQPADHYRLLGIERFESDPVTIASAADERMALVRTFQMGPYATETQQLLNELAAARICLLNIGAKASYDQMLEALSPSSTTSPQHVQFSPLVIDIDEKSSENANTFGFKEWLVVVTTSFVLIAGAATFVVIQRDNLIRSNVLLEQSSGSRIGELAEDNRTRETNDPILIYQEADGTVNLDASFAQLHGPTLRRRVSGNVDVISDWESMDDWVSWRFKVVTLPPQGIFHCRVTYAARPEADGGTFVIAIGDKEKECEIRGTGEVVTDEYFLAVPNSGDHDLTVRAKSKPSQRLMTLKSVTLTFPK
jgi:hypothetical protein